MPGSRGRTLFIALGLWALAQPQTAGAEEFFRNSGYGPVQRSMSGTGMAVDIGPSALISNPATMGLRPDGTWAEGMAERMVAPAEAINRATGEVVHSAKDGWRSHYLLAGFGLTHRAGRYTFGFFAGPESGAGSEFGNTSFLSRTPSGVDTGLEVSSRLAVIRAPLGVSTRFKDVLRPGDALHVGIAAEAIYVGINVNLLAADSQFAALAARGELTGSLVPTLAGIAAGGGGGHISASDPGEFEHGLEGYGIGGRLGLVYEASARTRVGLAYNFETKIEDLDGKATLTAISAAGAQTPLRGKLVAKDFQLPASVGLGVSHQITDDLLLAADAVHYFKARVYDEINLSFTSNAGGNVDLSIPQNARNFTVARMGAAWNLERLKLPNVTLRAGLFFSHSSLPNDRVLPIIPAVPKNGASGGLSVGLREGTIFNFAYTRGFERTAENPGLPNAPDGRPTAVGRNDRVFALSISQRF